MSRRLTAAMLTLAAAASLGVAGCGGAGGSASRAAASTGPAQRVTVTGDACASGWRAPGGGESRFEIADRASHAVSVSLEQAVSGIVVASAEVAPDATRRLDARLQRGGAYRFSCAIAGSVTRYSASVQVPGRTATADLASARSPSPPAVVDLIRPLSHYTRHELALLTVVRGRLRTLRALIAAGSLSGARSAWLAAHVTWLALGQDDLSYGAFGNLGGRIDGTAAGKVGGTASPNFTGFHKVELDLWRRRDLSAAGRDARLLSRLVGRLTPAAVTADLPATVTGMDNWVLRCHEILEDALRDSLSGDDDYGSDSDLVSVGADVDATREMLHLLGPLIRPRSPGLAATATRQLRTLDAAIAAAGHRRQSMAALPRRLRQRVDAAIGAVLESVAPVSELMQVGNS